MKMVSNWALALGGGAVAALLAASPVLAQEGGTCGPLTEMTTVSLGINPGSQALVTNVLKEQGFDKKYNLNVDVKTFVGVPAAATAVTQKVVDLGYGDITTMAIARAQGTDVVFYGPFMTTPQDGVFVPKDSPVKTLSDLRGKKIGSFTPPGGATMAIVIAIADKSYGIPDLAKAADIVVAPPPALFGLLDRGNIDAVLALNTDSVAADLTGKYRRILDVDEGYRQAFGSDPMFIGLVSTDSFLKDHCSVVKAFAHAQTDAIEYMKTHDSVWANFAQQLKMTDPRAGEALKVLRAGFTDVWGEAEVRSTEELLTSMIPILGAKDFISKVPDGLFTTGYWHD